MRTSLNGKAYTRTLSASEFGGSNLEGYDFKNATGTQEVIIVWTSDGISRNITLPSGVTAVKDKYNNSISYSSTLAVSGDPRFIFLVPLPPGHPT